MGLQFGYTVDLHCGALWIYSLGAWLVSMLSACEPTLGVDVESHLHPEALQTGSGEGLCIHGCQGSRGDSVMQPGLRTTDPGQQQFQSSMCA